MKLKSLTNTRPIKETGCELIAAPTPGGFKLSDEGATVLGVVVGDRIDIGEDVESGNFVIGRGFGSDDGDVNGSKLGKSGSYLTLSASAAWQKMGDANENRHYIIDKENGETITVPGTEEEVTYYPLIFDRAVAKQQRASSSEDAAGADQDMAASAVESAGGDLEDL